MRSTDSILSEIARLTGIQKKNPPSSKEWQAASVKLKPLFEEMAKRTGDK